MPDSPPPNSPPPLLKELTAEAFQLWRHNPITALFLRFLADKAEDYQHRALADLLSNSLPLETQHEYRGRIWALRELQELNLEDIRRLYGISEPTVEEFVKRVDQPLWKP